MKGRGVLLLAIIFLLINSILVSAQDGLPPAPRLEDELEDFKNEFEKGRGEFEGFTEEDKWDLLSERWQAHFLNNSIIAKIDATLKQANPVLEFIFGMEYSLSLIFLIAIILWVALLVSFYEIFRLYSPFSEATALIGTMVMTFLLSNLRIFPPEDIAFTEWAALGIFKVIFFREGIWSIVSFIIFILISIALIMGITSVFKSVRKRREEALKRLKEKLQKTNQDILDKYVKGIVGGTKETVKANAVALIFIPAVAVVWIIAYFAGWISSLGTFWGFLIILAACEIILVYQSWIRERYGTAFGTVRTGGGTYRPAGRRDYDVPLSSKPGVAAQFIILPLLALWIIFHLFTNFISPTFFWIVIIVFGLIELFIIILSLRR